MRIAAVLLLIALAGGGLAAQAPPAAGAQAADLVFEAATIKPNHSGSGDHGMDSDPGTLRATNVSLHRLIARANGLRDQQVAGPDWLDSEYFDVNAKASFAASDEQLLAMLRTLLQQRFEIVAHREMRPMPVYNLVVAGKPKMPAVAAGGDTSTNGHNGEVELTAESTTQTFADRLSSRLDRPVIDMTGLTGFYTFKLDWSPPRPDGSAPSDAGAPPDIFTAIQDQLGLKLVAARGPVEVLVIDAIRRAPVDN